MNCLPAPSAAIVRFRINSPSWHGSIPDSSSRVSISSVSPREKTASIPAEGDPERTTPRSARSPKRNFSAPRMTDFPAPVSPVTAVNPAASSHSSSTTRARFRILRDRSIADMTGTMPSGRGELKRSIASSISLLGPVASALSLFPFPP